jgi:hypothetical protein
MLGFRHGKTNPAIVSSDGGFASRQGTKRITNCWNHADQGTWFGGEHRYDLCKPSGSNGERSVFISRRFRGNLVTVSYGHAAVCCCCQMATEPTSVGRFLPVFSSVRELAAMVVLVHPASLVLVLAGCVVLETGFWASSLRSFGSPVPVACSGCRHVAWRLYCQASKTDLA